MTLAAEGKENIGFVRNIYRRAVRIPLENVEQLWLELYALEKKSNGAAVCEFCIQRLGAE